jgi:hypothetical protein
MAPLNNVTDVARQKMAVGAAASFFLEVVFAVKKLPLSS